MALWPNVPGVGLRNERLQVRVLPGSIEFLNLPEVALTYCSFETCPGHFKCFPSQLQPSGDSMLAYELASSRNCFLAFIGGSRLNKLLEWLACIHSNNIKFMCVGLICLRHLRGCFQSNLTITHPIYTTGVFGECCERNASIAARFAAGHPTKRTR